VTTSPSTDYSTVTKFVLEVVNPFPILFLIM